MALGEHRSRESPLIFQIADPFCVFTSTQIYKRPFLWPSCGSVRQWCRRETPEMKILGWIPGEHEIFIIVPRIRTKTKYKIEKVSDFNGDRTHNLHLPRLTYIPLVHPCASHRRNKLYKCMSHYCTERLAIFSHYQNPTSSSWETVIRISDPDLNPDHAQLWTRSSYDHYLPTHQISSKSDQ